MINTQDINALSARFTEQGMALTTIEGCLSAFANMAKDVSVMQEAIRYHQSRLFGAPDATDKASAAIDARLHGWLSDLEHKLGGVMTALNCVAHAVEPE